MPKIVNISLPPVVEKRKRGRPPRRSMDRIGGYELPDEGSTPSVGANMRDKIIMVVSSGDYTACQIADKLSKNQKEWDKVHSLVFAMIAAGDIVKDYATNVFRIGEPR